MRTPREYRFRLEHILDSIIHIKAVVAGKSYDEYREDWALHSAVERGVEIISEASRHLPAEIKASEAGIDWKKIAGVGNVLRHDYDRVANEVIYQVATENLDDLEQAVRRLLGLKPGA